MMSDRIMAFLAFAILTGFLAILVWYVPRLDLGAVIAITVVLAGWDFFGPKKG
jgi:hypothetical protein